LVAAITETAIGIRCEIATAAATRAIGVVMMRHRHRRATWTAGGLARHTESLTTVKCMFVKLLLRRGARLVQRPLGAT
jgi:hypothetical protein